MGMTLSIIVTCQQSYYTEWQGFGFTDLQTATVAGRCVHYAVTKKVPEAMRSGFLWSEAYSLAECLYVLSLSIIQVLKTCNEHAEASWSGSCLVLPCLPHSGKAPGHRSSPSTCWLSVPPTLSRNRLVVSIPHRSLLSLLSYWSQLSTCPLCASSSLFPISFLLNPSAIE
jgi:hypothetical protein